MKRVAILAIAVAASAITLVHADGVRFDSTEIRVRQARTLVGKAVGFRLTSDGRSELGAKTVGPVRLESISASPSGKTIALAATFDHVVLLADDSLLVKEIIGGYGQGPGSFDRPSEARFIADDTLVVCEVGNARFSMFTSEGRYIAAAPQRGPLQVRHFGVQSNRRIYFQYLNTPGSGGADLYAFNWNSHANLDSIAMGPVQLTVGEISPQFLERSALIAPLPSGDVLLAYQVVPMLRVVSNNLKVTRTYDLDIPEVDRIISIAAPLDIQLERDPHRFVMPRIISAVAVGEGGVTYLATNDPSDQDCYHIYQVILGRDILEISLLIVELPGSVVEALVERRRRASLSGSERLVYPQIISMCIASRNRLLLLDSISRMLVEVTLD